MPAAADPQDTAALVATLVASPERPVLTLALLADLAQASGVLAPGRDPAWLADGVAADWPVAEGVPAATAREALEAALVRSGAPVDVIVQPVSSRRKRLFLADMDSTMIGQECIDELADFVGLKSEVSAITERAMRGEIAFEPALRERVALLRGLPVSTVDRILAERISYTPGGRALVRTMRANGAYTALVSGGFTVFTGPVAGALGFDEHRSNTLLVEGDVLAGQVADPIVGREAKLAALVELRDRFDLDRALTLAVGDGANDLAMLGEAGLGVAFRAKPAVAAAADVRLDHADLTALLYAQGYRRDQFIGE